MAVLADNLYQEFSTGREWSFPLKASASIVYQGALVMISTTTGLAEKGADSANMILGGVALEYVDNSAGVASAKSVKVIRKGTVRFATGSTAATRAAFVGQDVYIYDDNHVDLVSVTSNDVKVGRCIDIDAQGFLIIDLATN